MRSGATTLTGAKNGSAGSARGAVAAPFPTRALALVACAASAFAIAVASYSQLDARMVPASGYGIDSTAVVVATADSLVTGR